MISDKAWKKSSAWSNAVFRVGKDCMNSNDRWAQHRNRALQTAAALLVCLLAGIASRSTPLTALSQSEDSQTGKRSDPRKGDQPEAEFHMARMIYKTFGGAGSHGIIQPWWAVDYPFAEEHFLAALRRLTKLSVADDSRHLELTDERLFDYPFLFMQQPGNGNWRPTDQDAERLREYLERGGFLLVDDMHGEYEWAIFEAAIRRVLPDRPIVEIPDDDPLMNVFFNLGDRIQIPGLRHLVLYRDGQIGTRMEGPPHWRGIYDDQGRLEVAINFNMDMGDAWEHADDPWYPAPMTGQAYRLGVNYVIYAMTH